MRRPLGTVPARAPRPHAACRGPCTPLAGSTRPAARETPAVRCAGSAAPFPQNEGSPGAVAENPRIGQFLSCRRRSHFGEMCDPSPRVLAADGPNALGPTAAKARVRARVHARDTTHYVACVKVPYLVSCYSFEIYRFGTKYLVYGIVQSQWIYEKSWKFVNLVVFDTPQVSPTLSYRRATLATL